MAEVLRATSGKLVAGREGAMMRGVSTDTRTIKRGNLFFALQGERFDGHDYLPLAFRKGAGGAVVMKNLSPRFKGKNIARVTDTTRALGDLASFWRRRFSIPVVAVTGSNGKTTTKEMIAQILSEKYPLLKTEGNLNNAIGLPQNLFRLGRRHKVAVLEMGMNAPGEIRRLVEIASPQVGVITNVGRAHLQGVGSLRDVVRAKGELLEGLPRRDGVAFLNGDSPYLSSLRKMSHVPVVTFGWGKRCHVRGSDFRVHNLRGVSFQVHSGGEAVKFSLPALGSHNVENALAAIAVGRHFGVSWNSLKRALAHFKGLKWRLQVVRTKHWTILNDGYNANPDSTEKALAFLGQIQARRRVAILGDMFELGDHASPEHKKIGGIVARTGVDLLVGVGRRGRDLCQGAVRAGFSKDKAFFFPHLNGRSCERIHSLLERGDLVLVKGSRGMHLERLVEALRH